MKTNLLILGSANIDHVMDFDCLPTPGQTLMSRSYRLEHGGKGANQAVAAARLRGGDAKVEFICHLGEDALAETMIQSWLDDGMHGRGIKRIPEQATGSAMIFIGKNNGQNMIGVAAGANATLDSEAVNAQHERFVEADYLLIQLETPIESVHQALKLARSNAARTILNPAPARALSSELLALVDIITPNETEAKALTGVEVTDEISAAEAAAALHRLGVATVVITMGSHGAYVSSDEFTGLVPACKTTVVDTVAAGDTFNGALMIALSEGKGIQAATEFANKAAAIAVSRYGAQRGIPYRRELDN